jgi:hypothetical protein
LNDRRRGEERYMLPETLKVLRKFGRMPLTGRDFIELSDQNAIEVVMSSDVRRGYYYCTRGKHTIVLPMSLSAEKRQLVAWHEFAHFLQNFCERRTMAACSGLRPDLESERLADIFAQIATQPEEIGITGPVDFIRMIMRTPFENHD